MPFLEALFTKAGAALTVNAVGASAKRIRRSFAGSDEAQALGRCFQRGCRALFEHVEFPEPDDEHAIRTLFLDFAKDEEVGIELRELLGGRRPDLETLSERFRAAGYEHPLELTPGFEAFEQAFVLAADNEAAIRPLIIVGELRTMRVELKEQTKEARKQTGHLGSIDRMLDERLPDPARRAAEARAAYLGALYDECQRLPRAFRGTDTVEREVQLGDIFVDLRTRTTRVLVDGRWQEHEATDDDPLLEARFPEAEKEQVTAREAVETSRVVVILGGPGSGKSSFVKHWVAEQIEALEAGEEGAALPVFLTLRELAPRLRALRLPPSADAQEEVLAEAIAEHLSEQLGAMQIALGEGNDPRLVTAEAFEERLRGHIKSGRYLLVADGLDEVPQADRARVRQAVQALLARHRPRQAVVTCRSRSYTGAARLAESRAYTLAPFDPEQVAQFARAWYTAQSGVGRCTREEATDRGDDLAEKAVEIHYDLAQTPLLLATMARVHLDDVTLPRERVKLYRKAVKLLMEDWKKAGAEALPEELLAVLQDETKVRAAMERLAYEAHQTGAGQRKEADLPEGRALTILKLAAYFGDAGVADAFLRYADLRAGLLVGRGSAEGEGSIYTFPHRTFQEYLAGCYVFGRRDREVVDLLGRHARQGDIWTEAVEMGIEEQFYHHETKGQLNLLDVLYKIREQVPGDEAGERVVFWGGLIADVLGRETISRDEKGKGADKLAAFLMLLSGRLRGALGVQERVRAGNLLAQLGDPRKEVMRPEATVFHHVAAGPFWMGEGEGKEGRHRCTVLDYGYWIARYPVTVAQFKEFYREQPFEPGNADSLRGPDNHPVVRRSWHEAQSYAAWLTGRLRAAAPERLRGAETDEARQLWEGLQAGRLEAALPSEAEWERAARGTEGRIYPWGEEEPEPERANYDETKIGTTSAVGCFRQGATPEGIEDLAGNVWEWTRSLWGEKYPYPYRVDEREDLAASDKVGRVLRGGSFSGGGGSLRCAFRGRNFPDARSGSSGLWVVVRPSSDL